MVRTLKTVAPFSEAEINAIYTDKKINDELRGFKTPYEDTVKEYRNDPAVIENLVRTVTDNFKISHRFYRVKARLLKLKSLSYSDRAAKIGAVKTKFTFETSAKLLKDIFGKLNPRFSATLDSFMQDGRIDAYPRPGKKAGAYCWSAYSCPTFVLLNHTDDLNSFMTFAHEFGHAFHAEFARSQGAIYCSNSMSLAETASTLFESIALDAVYDTLPDEEKIIVLHDKINDDISTIFRQTACFNFENDIHAGVRTKGYVSASEIAQMHNKDMAAYLGPQFKMKPDDGYYFVHWGHIRRFFYVYSYAYGQLVSKAMLRRYKADPSFWKSIEKFLSSGGKDSPENILKEIGIDVSKPDFWIEGLREVEEDIAKLEKLTKK
jgi:oligoendopeptidase F